MTTAVSIRIETENAAFEGDPAFEVSRIIREYAEHINVNGLVPKVLFDVNGNKVGEANVM